MTHEIEKHGKRLLMRQSMSGSDRIQDNDDDDALKPVYKL